MKKMVFLFLFLLVACQQRSCRDTRKEVSLSRGKYLYEMHCASCHGAKGDGKGAVADFLWPKPRDFTAGIFKYRSNRSAIPNDLDLLQTMKKGIPGTSMPGWDLLGVEEWLSVLSYVKSFSPRLLNEKPGHSIDVPEEIKPKPESIQAGRRLYENSGCVACHGFGGGGDGPGAIVLKDVWGERIAPRNLRHGLLKWGNSAGEIYRTLMIGIPGTPMPAYEQTFTRAEMWSLVHYLKSIQRPLPENYDPSDPKRNLLVVHKVMGDIPIDNENEAWARAKPIPVFLKPLWADPRATEWLTVKALQNGKEIAFSIEWEDDQMNIPPNPSDAVAIQFPFDKIAAASELPYLGMGDLLKKVHIWQWKGGGFKKYLAAGVSHVTVEEGAKQNVSGNGAYENGRWHVILKGNLPKVKEGYLSFGLWDEDLPGHRGPEAFSEWMVYELRE